MQEEILKRLDALAAKLGVTAQYLWGVMVRQAHVEGLFYVGIAALFLVLAVAGVLVARRCHGASETLKESTYRTDPFEVGFYAGIAGAVFSAVMVVVNASCAVTPILNPEFWALKQIMEAMK